MENEVKISNPIKDLFVKLITESKNIDGKCVVMVNKKFKKLLLKM